MVMHADSLSVIGLLIGYIVPALAIALPSLMASRFGGTFSGLLVFTALAGGAALFWLAEILSMGAL